MPKKINLLEALRKLLSEKQQAELLALFMQDSENDDKQQAALLKIIKDWDVEKHRKPIGKLLAECLPIEQLVPDCYAEWRPIVRESVIYIGPRLSITRLLPKLFEQVMLPETTTLEQRLMTFIEQMPTLQKLGQVIARNRNLSPAFRTALIQLENGIRDISVETIRTQIEQELGARLKQHKVELEELVHAEASVCALMRFSWMNPQTQQQEHGIFKVLKPHIKEHFAEEIRLLNGLASHLESNKEPLLKAIDLHETFTEIGSLLEQELNTLQEQDNLAMAYECYRTVPGVHVPQLIRELSTCNITAMQFERGTKVTDAFIMQPGQRHKLATQIIESLIATPLFAAEEEAVFHADPHAGNLFVNETTHDLIVFDWALTGRLNREERRKIIMLFLAITLRDENLLLESLTGLSQGKLSPGKAKQLQHKVSRCIEQLSLYKLPGVNDVLALTDELLLIGIRFSPALMLFRKVLLTLDGVLHDMGDEIAIEAAVAQYVLQNLGNEMVGFNLWQQARPNFQLPLSNSDTFSLMWSAQWYYFRTGLQNSEQFLKHYR